MKKEFWKKLYGLNVYIVDEKEIEDNYEDTFVGGGHHYVKYYEGERLVDYSTFIGENEIFINKPDMALFIHEFVERILMKVYGFDYDKAHAIASLVETLWRHQHA
jgi:hypothetical protein